MNLTKIIFIILFIPSFLHGQNTQKRFDRIIQNISNQIAKNYQTEDLQDIEHFEFTYNSQKELIEAVYIDGVQIAPIRMWDLKQDKLQQKSGHPEAKSGHPYFHAELFTTNKNGTLITKYERGSLTFYASDMPYFPISRIFVKDFLLPSLMSHHKEMGANPMSFSVGKKTLSSEKSDSKWIVVDTVYNDADCLKLIHAECVNYFFTKQDSLDLLNTLFPSRSEENKTEEIIKFWNGAKICTQETFIIYKKDNAVLLFQSSKEATDNTGQNFSEYFCTEFEKQGKRYVPKKFFFNGHNYIENSPFFSQSGNQTLIVRTPSAESKSLKMAKFSQRGGFDLYLHFCDLLKEPSPRMLEFWEIYKDMAK